MPLISSFRDFVSSWWPMSSTTKPATPAAPPATPSAPKPREFSTGFDTTPGRPVTNRSEADVLKSGARANGLLQKAQSLKTTQNADLPSSQQKLTREEGLKVLEFSGRYDAMFKDWAATSPLMRGTRVMSRDEAEAHFSQNVFQPAFETEMKGVFRKAADRFNEMVAIASEMKAGANWSPDVAESEKKLTREELNLVGGFSNLYESKLADWAKTTPLTRGTRVMSKDELEQHFKDEVFMPLFKERQSEYFAERLG